VVWASRLKGVFAMAKIYQAVVPCVGLDGKVYCAGDYTDNFSGYHLAHERERGNLLELECIGEAATLEQVPNGALVSFGAGIPKLWRVVID
jgi:hypothetical protein